MVFIKFVSNKVLLRALINLAAREVGRWVGVPPLIRSSRLEQACLEYLAPACPPAGLCLM